LASRSLRRSSSTPARIAEKVATVDLLSRGRVEWGIATPMKQTAFHVDCERSKEKQRAAARSVVGGRQRITRNTRNFLISRNAWSRLSPISICILPFGWRPTPLGRADRRRRRSGDGVLQHHAAIESAEPRPGSSKSSLSPPAPAIRPHRLFDACKAACSFEHVLARRRPCSRYSYPSLCIFCVPTRFLWILNCVVVR